MLGNMKENGSASGTEFRRAPLPAQPRLQIGAWSVNPALDEISCDGKVIKLEPRSMRILLYLAANPGRVVGLQELLDAIWPNVLVTPQSVYNVVAQLRRVLGDSSDSPTYIATVPRKGYRLVADVRTLDSDRPASPASATASAPAQPEVPLGIDRERPSIGGDRRPQMSRSRASTWGVATGLLVVALALVAALARKQGLWPRPAPAAAASTAAPVVALDRSIAVLPFLDISENRDQQYFADGMTEELIDALTKVPDLRVAARASAFYYKGKQTPISDIARTLKVAHLLEGSVRRDGPKVRVTVQLSDAQSGTYLWSQTYDRDIKDVLQVETDVASSIAQALKITLTAAESARLAQGGTRNVAAYDAFLRGEQRLLSGADQQGDARAALVLFDQAVALDPDYAVAHASRARALDTLAIFHVDSRTRDDVRRQALAAGERAVELAPDLGEAHIALAITRAYGLLDFAGAAPEFDRAVALAPGNARVQRLYAEFSSALGHREQALAAAQRTVSLDPQNYLSHMTLARAFFQARRFREALAAYRDAAAMKPGSNWIEGNVAGALIASEQYEAAREMCESRSNALADDNRHWCLALVYHSLGRRADAERELAALRKMAGDEAASAYAQIYANWGDAAAALAWLDKAERRHDPALQSLRVSYLLDPVRERPEYKAIEARLNLPP